MNFTQASNKGIIRLILVLFCIIIGLFSIAAQNSHTVTKSQSQKTSTPEPPLARSETLTVTNTVDATEIETLTQTPFPDWAMTSKDTNGLLVAGILILLIIIVGTLTAMTKNLSQPTKNN
jgi:hypothetical protein